MERATAEFSALGETTVFLELFQGFAGPAPARQDNLPACGGSAVVPARGAGRSRDVGLISRGSERRKLGLLRRFRPFRDGTPSHDHLGDIFATLDAREIPALLRRLGCGADRHVAGRCDCHRRQDAAPILPEEGRESANPHGFGVCGAPSASCSARSKSRKHPTKSSPSLRSLDTDGHRGCHRDHRCDGVPTRYCCENLGEEGRLHPRAQRQSRHTV